MAKRKQVTLEVRRSEQTGKWMLYVGRGGKKPTLRATFDTKAEAQASAQKNAAAMRRNQIDVEVVRGKDMR